MPLFRRRDSLVVLDPPINEQTSGLRIIGDHKSDYFCGPTVRIQFEKALEDNVTRASPRRSASAARNAAETSGVALSHDTG